MGCDQVELISYSNRNASVNYALDVSSTIISQIALTFERSQPQGIPLHVPSVLIERNGSNLLIVSGFYFRQSRPGARSHP